MTGGGMGGAGGKGGIATGGAGMAATGACAAPHHGQKSTGWGNGRPHPEDAAHAMHGDRANRVVDLGLVLEEEDRLDDEDAGKTSDDRCRPHSFRR